MLLRVSKGNSSRLPAGVIHPPGARLSLGIANPTDFGFTVIIGVGDCATGQFFVRESMDLAPRQLVQLNRLADLWNLPTRDCICIDVSSSTNDEVFYAYASVARNDTGDATFVFGTTPHTGPQ